MQVFGLVVIVVLFAIVIVGTVLGRRYRVGPPVLLIGLGALLGLVPRFGHVRLDGEIVLLLFLPAILYWESLNTSFREIRANLRVIVLLSVGLVIASAVAVSWTARAFGMESHAASVLGAVLSPTDAAAVAGLAKRLPRRTLTVLKAESLINDGTALVLFGVAVSVAMGGAPVGPVDLTVRFVLSYLGGIAAGLLVGGVVTLVRQRLDAPQEEAALSLLTPFAAFLLANAIDCSGVVAVLVSALVLAYVSPRVIRARSRLVTFAFWDIATFLINGSLWVFVGVQIPSAMRGISRVDGGVRHAVLLAFAVTGVVVATRLIWGECTTALVRTVDRREAQRARRVDWRQRAVSGWAGFRGAVSLAAAHRGSADHPQRRAVSRPQPDHLRGVVRDSHDRHRPGQHTARPSSAGPGFPRTSPMLTNCALPAATARKPPWTRYRWSPPNSASATNCRTACKRNTEQHAALVRLSDDGSTPSDAEGT